MLPLHDPNIPVNALVYNSNVCISCADLKHVKGILLHGPPGEGAFFSSPLMSGRGVGRERMKKLWVRSEDVDAGVSVVECGGECVDKVCFPT